MGPLRAAWIKLTVNAHFQLRPKLLCLRGYLQRRTS